MRNKMHIQDGSGDKRYFTIIPNFILNHSTANDQALYLQMKRVAGEGGVCEAGSRYFMKQMGIGRQAYNTSLSYLLEKGWISHFGKKKVLTHGGIQEVNVYHVNDLWELNNAHYLKGGSKSTPLRKSARGGSRTASEVVLNQQQGGSKSAPKKNIKKEHKEKHNNKTPFWNNHRLVEVSDGVFKVWFGHNDLREFGGLKSEIEWR